MGVCNKFNWVLSKPEGLLLCPTKWTGTAQNGLGFLKSHHYPSIQFHACWVFFWTILTPEECGNNEPSQKLTNPTFPSGSQMIVPQCNVLLDLGFFFFNSQVLATSPSVALEYKRRVATGNRLFLILPCYLELISHMLLLLNSLHEFSQIFVTYVISICRF